jgi:hypothetical protein
VATDRNDDCIEVHSQSLFGHQTASRKANFSVRRLSTLNNRIASILSNDWACATPIYFRMSTSNAVHIF